MRIVLALIMLLVSSCTAPKTKSFYVLKIGDGVDVDYLLKNGFFQTEGYNVAFDKQLADTIIVFELENEGERFEPYTVNWIFPASSSLSEAKTELNKLGITRLLELQKNIECESCEPLSITFIGQTDQKDTYRIFWGPNLETDPFPDDFDKDYKLRIEYSFNPTFDETYNIN